MIRVTIRRFSQLSKGDSHSFAIKEGKLYGWGMNNFGQLGFKNTKEWTEEMREPVGQLPPMKSVSAGVSHTTAIDENGLLWTWGANNYGQLGNGKTFESNYFPQCIYNTVAYSQISSTGMSNIALDVDGNIWTWGWNNGGKLGFSFEEDILEPKKHDCPVKISSIYSGIAHSIAIDENKDVWVFGDNKFNQLGVDSIRRTLSFQKHPDLSSITSAACGMGTTIVLDSNGDVYQSGTSKIDLFKSTNVKHKPFSKVLDLPEIEEISCGSFHHIVKDKEGQFWGWGSGDRGQFGNESRADIEKPKKLDIPYSIKQFICGADSTIFLTSDNEILFCGKKYFNANGNTDILKIAILNK